MVRTLPTVTRLQSVDRELTFAPDGTASCRLHLDRTTLFSGPLQIALMDDPSSRGLTAEPVIISAGKTEALLVVRHKAGEKLSPKATLRFRGTGDLGQGATVIAEVVVPIHQP